MFDRNTMRAVALASQLGFAVAFPLLACGGGGFWLGHEWGIGPWLGFAGLLLGLVAAGLSIYQLAIAIPARQTAKAKPKSASAPDEQDHE